MGKLIRYELRKQRTSRMVIFIALAIALAVFWIGIFRENETMLGISISAMVFGAVLVLFYTGIESILVFNRDLRTKQSYMLWMLPRSIWEILGAKFISAILQMLIVFGISCTAVGVSVAGAVWKLGGVAELLKMAKEISRSFVEGGLEWTDVAFLAFLIFLSWTLVIMIGFLSVILSRTILVKSKFAGLFAVILFFVINFAIERTYAVLSRLPLFSMAGGGPMGWSLWDSIFYIAVCLMLFGVSGVLAEKKLSV